MEKFWKENRDHKLVVYQHLVLSFLEYNGYRNIKLNGIWKIARFNNHIIDFIEDTIEIRRYLIDHIKSYGDFFGKEQVLEQTLKLFSNIKKSGLLDGLKEIELNLLENNHKETYKFFKDKVVKITPESISFLDYKDLSANVLRGTIIDRELEIISETAIWSSDFPVFLFRCMNEDDQRFHNLLGILGYLSSGYKSRKDDKAVVFCDGLIEGLPEGGTGKSLTATALNHFNNTVIEDGKNFKFTNFTFQQVTYGTKLLIIDDANKKLNFENLFASITGGFQIEKKYQDKQTLSFEDSPKILITTNYTIYGKGYSFERRIIEVEFSDYYGRFRKPLDDFKKEFFNSWGKTEWSLFFHFMLKCVQHYLRYNELHEISINDPVRKRLIRETTIDFFTFISESDLHGYIRKSDLFNEFLDEFPEYKKWLSIRKFNGWIKDYCLTMKIEFYESKMEGGKRCWKF